MSFKKIIAPLVLLSILIYSCELAKLTNVCDSTNCYNGGVCLDGDCECRYGWSGDSCTVLYDTCGLLNCGPHSSSCRNGLCNCHDGWSGDSCHILTSSLYVGFYDITENYGRAPDSIYTDSIVYYADSTRIKLKGIRKNTDSVRANLRGDSLYFFGNSRIQNGYGVFRKAMTGNRDTIHLWYTYRPIGAAIADTCRAIWIKR